MSRFLTDIMSKKADEKPKLEVVQKQEIGTTGTTNLNGTTNTTDTTGTINTTGTTGTTSKSKTVSVAKQPISPEKDFTKTPNSVVRIAVAQGLFRGKSKQIYDYLWQVSRGAINPNRRVRKTFNEIQKGSGLGSRNTVLAGITHLENVGLIIREKAVGEAAGNTYEVFTPEELGFEFGTTGSTNTFGTTGITKTTQKVEVPVQPDFGTTGTTQTQENKDLDETLRHSFKTLKYVDDDAPVINLLEIFNGMARKLTGKDLTKKELEKLSEAAEILVNETVIAAARTGSVSAPISFMVENLRRRLYTKPRPAGKKEARPKHLDIGKGSEQKPDGEISWTPQTPLTEDQRQNTLDVLKEAKAADAVTFREFKTFGEIEYTAEDFKWLMENLEE